MTQEKVFVLQSYLFCLLAILASFIHIQSPSLGTSILVFILIILGIPHGALDALFARELFNFTQLGAWCKFVFTYMLIATSVVVLWILSSTIFLIVFLMMSIWHFSDDLVAGIPILVRLIYGGVIIFLPAIYYTNELNLLYGYLTDTNSAQKIVMALSFMSIPWLILVVVSLIYLFGKSKNTFLELASLSILAIMSHPLMAFSIYFCVMHSARHIIRSINFLEGSSKKSILLAAVLPTAAVLIIWVVLFKSLSVQLVDSSLIKLVFVSLAALTAPHMLMLEQTGFTSWIKMKP